EGEQSGAREKPRVAIFPIAAKLHHRPEQRKTAPHQPARNEPGGKIRPLDFKATPISEVAQKGAEKKRKGKSEKHRVKRVKRSQRNRDKRGSHDSSSPPSLACMPARKEIVGRGAGESSGAGGFLVGGCGEGFVKRLCVRDHG